MIDSKKTRNAALLKNYSGPCPYCHYQLKNPENSRCPECGSRLKFHLIAPFRFSPWHAMVISFAISSGVCLDRTFLSIVGVFNSNFGVGALKMLVVFALGLTVVVAGFYVVWRHKSWFLGIPRWKRVVWYLVALFIPVILTVVQFFIILNYALAPFHI
jgi:amino acid transporter